MCDIRGETLARLYWVISNRQHHDDHDTVYRAVKKEAKLHVRHATLNDRRTFLLNLLQDGIGTREIEAMATNILGESRNSRHHRSAEHVKWIREILQVRITKLDRDIRCTERMLQVAVSDNGHIDNAIRQDLWRIIQSEVQNKSKINHRRLGTKRVWLRRIFNYRHEIQVRVPNSQEPAAREDVPSLFSLVETHDKELDIAYRNDDRFSTDKEDFVVYGDIPLSESEKAFLNLPPKFRIHRKPSEEQVETEVEKSHVKARYQLMQDEESDQEHDNETLHPNETQPSLNNSASELQVNSETVTIHHNENDLSVDANKISFAKQRVTDFPTNTTVLAPRHASEDDEVRMHGRKMRIMSALEEYNRDVSNRPGSTNLTPLEAKGLQSLKGRVKRNEIIINPTDKSGKYSITTPELYRSAALAHVSNDVEVSNQVTREVEDEANKVSMQMVKVLRLGLSNGQERRMRSAFRSTNNPPPPTYFYFKDHKTICDNNLCPPTRPICGANEGPLMRLSNLVSDVLEEVVAHDSMTDILCDSTEDMLSRIEQTNVLWNQDACPSEGGIGDNDLGMESDKIKESAHNKEMFTDKLVVMSEDVEALYPSITHNDTMCAIEELMKRSSVTMDVDWKEMSKYIAVNGGISPANGRIQQFIPVPSNQNRLGRPRTNTFLSQTDESKWRWNNQCEPDNSEIRELFTVMIMKVVSFVMKNHIYSFDGKVYRQTKGGPIGLRLTGVLAKIVMIEFGRRWKELTSELGIYVPLDAIYVDDHNIATREVKPGVRYNSDRRYIFLEQESVVRDRQLSATQRTAAFITSITNTIMPGSIKMKHDVPDNHEDGWLPVLDLQLRINGSKIDTRFYRKPMASVKVIHKRSAVSNKAKRSILIQEGLRRMYNCSPHLAEEEKAKILEEFGMSMKVSGHRESFRRNILRAVVDKYTKDLMAHQAGTSPIYRSKQERGVQLMRQRSKVEWLRKIGYNNLLVLPATPKSSLLKRVTNKLRNMEEPKGIRTYITEDYGIAGKQLLCRSDPFPRRRCGDNLCMACRNSGINGSRCQLSSVGYSITCRICSKEYIGTTSRNCKTRSIEHLKKGNSTINRHVATQHPEKLNEVADQYDMRVTGRFKDPLTRQVSEAVKINRAVRAGRELLNEKKEFGVLRLVSLSAESEH